MGSLSSSHCSPHKRDPTDPLEFLDLVEQIQDGLPARPGYLVPDFDPPQLLGRSQSIPFPNSPMLKRTRPTAGSGAKRQRAAAAKKTVAKIVNRAVNKSHELKTVSTFSNGATVTAAAQFTLLNGLAQGVGGGQRIGRDIKNEYIDFIFQLSGTAVNASDMVRFVVVRDKECRGAALSASDLFENAAAGQINYSLFYKDNLGPRFEILYDNHVQVAAQSATQTAWVTRTARVPVKRNTHYYDVATSGIAGIDAGSIYLVWAGQGASTTLCYNAQLNYRDA